MFVVLVGGSDPRTTPVGAASGREGVGLVTTALSPYQISPCPPARKRRAEFQRLWLYVFVRTSQLRFARWNKFDLKRGIWEIPNTRPALDAVPFSTLGTKWRRHSPYTLIPASDELAGADSQNHRQIRLGVCRSRQTVKTDFREYGERFFKDDGLRH